MFLTKLKLAGAVLLSTGLVAGGAGVLARDGNGSGDKNKTAPVPAPAVVDPTVPPAFAGSDLAPSPVPPPPTQNGNPGPDAPRRSLPPEEKLPPMPPDVTVPSAGAPVLPPANSKDAGAPAPPRRNQPV